MIENAPIKFAQLLELSDTPKEISALIQQFNGRAVQHMNKAQFINDINNEAIFINVASSRNQLKKPDIYDRYIQETELTENNKEIVSNQSKVRHLFNSLEFSTSSNQGLTELNQDLTEMSSSLESLMTKAVEERDFVSNLVNFFSNPNESDNILKLKDPTDFQIKAFLEAIKPIYNAPEEAKSLIIKTYYMQLQNLNQNTAKILNMQKNEISDLDLKLRLLENSTSTGNFIWRVDNISTRLQNQKDLALYSPPQTVLNPETNTPYKYSLITCLNGNNQGRGTHVSLYFVLMRSDFDDINDFPFNEKITFIVKANKNSNKADINQPIICDPNAASCAKPSKDLNPSFGIPQMIPLEDLQDYLINDSLYFNVLVGQDAHNKYVNNKPSSRCIIL